MRSFRTILYLALAICGAAFSQTLRLETVEGLKANKVAAQAADHKGIGVTAPPGVPGANEVPVKDFESGTMEAEISGEPGSGAAQGARRMAPCSQRSRRSEGAAGAGCERLEAGCVEESNRLVDRAWDHWTFSKHKGD